jgi:hypothetical protein
MRRINLARPVSGLLVLCLSLLGANQKSRAEEPCTETPVISVPVRPTVAYASDTTKCGVVEADLGGQRTWIQAGDRQDTGLFGMRFGITHNLDFHWQGGSYINVVDSSGGSRGGFGENWVGLKYRFLEQTKFRPAMGVFYDAKIPSDDASDTFGTGKFDQSAALIFSKDIRPEHLDFNIIPFLAGRPSAPGDDFNTGLALACYTPLSKKFTLVTEGYGATFLNPSNPGYASMMAGLMYTVKPRLVLDAGTDWGVTHAAPDRRVYAGVTVAMANVYGLLLPHR